MKTIKEITELAEKRYGTDPHSFGGQRDGFKEGFKQAQEMQLLQSCVSGSFSDMEAKWLLCYGEESRESKVKLDNEGRIDYQIDQMFNLFEEHTIWKRKEIEELFWKRITAIANYR